MKIWRKLNKVGAIQLKGTVYLLPADDDNYEFFSWLVSEVSGLEGEAALIKIDQVENISDEDIILLFNKQREIEYKATEKVIQDLESQVGAVQKGSSVKDVDTWKSLLNKCLREYEEINKRDFFFSETGTSIHQRLQALRNSISKTSHGKGRPGKLKLDPKNKKNYQAKTWMTRTNPFIDRMASAWLINRFIDKKARFEIMEESQAISSDQSTICFDIKNGEFTHVGELCTFEVILKSFNLKEKQLSKIAEIVHDLDVRDDRYSSAEAKGLEEILLGIRKSDIDDHTKLQKGMEVFEMLYVALT